MLSSPQGKELVFTELMSWDHIDKGIHPFNHERGFERISLYQMTFLLLFDFDSDLVCKHNGQMLTSAHR